MRHCGVNRRSGQADSCFDLRKAQYLALDITGSFETILETSINVFRGTYGVLPLSQHVLRQGSFRYFSGSTHSWRIHKKVVSDALRLHPASFSPSTNESSTNQFLRFGNLRDMGVYELSERPRRPTLPHAYKESPALTRLVDLPHDMLWERVQFSMLPASRARSETDAIWHILKRRLPQLDPQEHMKYIELECARIVEMLRAVRDEYRAYLSTKKDISLLLKCIG